MEGQHQSLFELVSTNISAVLNDVINKLPCRGYSVNIDFERWRFFVHGCVDSYSRKIMYLSCSGNNKAETVLAHFFTSGCCSWASLKDKRWPWC